MGCCLATARTPKPVPPPPNNHRHHRHHHHYHAKKPNSLTRTHVEKPETRSPPPAAIEEETVKEVLSETPISKPQNPEAPPEKITLSPPKEPKLAEEEPKCQAEKPPVSEASQLSQLSEACGISESYSYSTTTTATTIADREDEATSNRNRELGRRENGPAGQVRRKRPYSGELGTQRERPKPPRRMPEPAVGKRNRTETTTFRGREASQLRTKQRSGAVPTGVRRETVSSRSRSPATRNVGGVNRGGRGKSPGKVTGRAGGSSSVGVEESEKGNNKEAKEEVLAGKKEAKEEEGNDDGVSQKPQQQENESLENPLVSLECFIFV